MGSSGTGAEWPYDEWGRITRFLESARLAFARERSLWDSLALRDPDDVRISAPAHQGKYRVALSEHLSAVRDDEMLFGSVLIHSYALAESAGAVHLKLGPPPAPKIEVWGKRLLQTAGNSWTDVKGGKGGLVEVAVLRNTIAHGFRTIGESGAKRLIGVGVTSRPAGSTVTLSYTDLREYRARLRSLLNYGAVGR
jgi:hypothetical protein